MRHLSLLCLLTLAVSCSGGGKKSKAQKAPIQADVATATPPAGGANPTPLPLEEVSGLRVVARMTTSLQLAWNVGAPLFRVAWAPSGESPDCATGQTTSDNQAVVAGLSPNTSYVFTTNSRTVPWAAPAEGP